MCNGPQTLRSATDPVSQGTGGTRRHLVSAVIAGLAGLLSLPAGAITAEPPGLERPIILLTGFEPFGAGRPPNASWEGIKDLDGREGKGWNEASPEQTLAQTNGLAQTGGEEKPRVIDGRTQAVRDMISHYFSTWSKRDIKGYGECFVKEASIQHIDEAGRVTTYNAAPFVEWQGTLTRRANPPMVETPETIDVRFEQNLARVVVYWKLTAGSRVEYGYDHFTLVQQKGAWKIVNLVFYADERKD